MKCSNVLDWVCIIILIISGISWGLLGLFHFNLLHAVFGSTSSLVRIAYDIVGLAGVYTLVRCVTCYNKGKK